eukprot:CAMPEP_0170631882 /NCGR_PEP_ID=MMETSP0224-20130122/34934_1 /TAXON_ID=285029 /ORGANISM="Togula jolla, Strain CCCM 725" /LENGTH=137 /DNA_ID=CAMNT_0010960363 /DNA_START=169 /DNA_END=583 /DNA_ORIENTATION=-
MDKFRQRRACMLSVSSGLPCLARNSARQRRTRALARSRMSAASEARQQGWLSSTATLLTLRHLALMAAAPGAEARLRPPCFARRSCRGPGAPAASAQATAPRVGPQTRGAGALPAMQEASPSEQRPSSAPPGAQPGA